MTQLLVDFGGALLTFTLLLPIWEQRPLTTTDLVPGPYPLAVPAEQLAFAAQGFQYGDEEWRARMVQQFGKSQSQIAARELLRLLADESTAEVIATLCLQLANLPPVGPEVEAALAARLSEADWRIRFWAVHAYGGLAEANPARLLRVAKEDEMPRVRAKAVDALAPLAGKLSFADFAPLFEDADAEVRVLAWRAAGGSAGAAAQTAAFAKLVDGPDLRLRHALAAGLAAMPAALADGLGARLVGDAHPSVRAEAAVSLGKRSEAQAGAWLRQLAGDGDDEVRRVAAISLAAFPEVATIATLVERLGDGHPFVREAAEDSLVAIHPRQSVEAATFGRLADPEAAARLRVCNVLGRIGAEARREAIASQLTRETRSDTIVAALRALERLGYAGDEAVVQAHVEHEEVAVRAAAALALGHFASATVDASLTKLAGDEANPVVSAAIMAIGRRANPAFSPLLLKILNDTGLTARYSSDHRGQACWAVGRLPVLDKALSDRLLKQGTTPVIRTPMGNVFEPDYVLVAVGFALAQQARREPAVLPLFNRVYELHSRELSPDQMMSAGPNVLVPTPEMIDAANQAKAYLEGTTPIPGRRPTRGMQFPYRSTTR